MKKIKIIVACGGGIFTTSVVTDKIETLLRKNKIPFAITPSKITEIPRLTGADLIVVTGKTETRNKSDIPVLIGLPLFTGVGAEEFSEELLIKIKEISEGR